MTDDLWFLSATELARLILRRKVSSTEVVQIHLDRIERLNPALNAVVTLDAERALARAREADLALARKKVWGPLHGVPFTCKDTLATAGLRTTASHPPLADYVPSTDATVVARMKNAGAILLGKTNLPQLALDSQSNSPIFGVTKNPWNPARTPGGSSGGEAAAISAGLSPLGLGSDMGGSVRLPAHFCGLFAFKPTEHVVPKTGHIPPLPGSINTARLMLTIGALSRDPSDLALALKIMTGPDDLDTDVAPVDFRSSPPPPIERLRLAWTDQFGGIPVAPEMGKRLGELIEDLTRAGCRCEKQSPSILDFDFEEAWKTYGELMAFTLFPVLPAPAHWAFKVLHAFRSDDPLMEGVVRVGKLTVRRYLETLAERDRLIGGLEKFLAKHDAWLCPVASAPADPIRKAFRPQKQIVVAGNKIPYGLAYLGYTAPFNLTGHPAVTLPFGRTEGLPFGLQVVGPRWSDFRLLALAQSLVPFTGEFERPPGF